MLIITSPFLYQITVHEGDSSSKGESQSGTACRRSEGGDQPSGSTANSEAMAWICHAPQSAQENIG